MSKECRKRNIGFSNSNINLNNDCNKNDLHLIGKEGIKLIKVCLEKDLILK